MRGARFFHGKLLGIPCETKTLRLDAQPADGKIAYAILLARQNPAWMYSLSNLHRKSWPILGKRRKLHENIYYFYFRKRVILEQGIFSKTMYMFKEGLEYGGRSQLLAEKNRKTGRALRSLF
jgi:hypothetical protein